MAHSLIAPAALADIEAILAWTEENFGTDARNRYALLIGDAISNVVENPEQIGVRKLPEIAATARTYHLSFARRPRTAASVKHPRHFLLFHVLADGMITIGRVCHDQMDLRHQVLED